MKKTDQKEESYYTPKASETKTGFTPPSSPGRRTFIGTVAAGVVALPLLGSKNAEARTGQESTAPQIQPETEMAPANDKKQSKQSFSLRFGAAQRERDLPIDDHQTNGDEQLYPNKIGNFSKALPHNTLGEVDLTAYNSLIKALSSGSPADFENI